MTHTDRAATLIAILLPLAAGAAAADAKSLCDGQESTVWSCQARGKTYSICSSTVPGSRDPQVQYRAGRPGKVEFRYPEVPGSPREHFEFGYMAHGAWLGFRNGPYSYDISEPLIGQAVIDVSKNDQPLSTIQCERSSASLAENSTHDLFVGRDR